MFIVRARWLQFLYISQFCRLLAIRSKRGLIPWLPSQLDLSWPTILKDPECVFHNNPNPTEYVKVLV
jgi:hypothetical protein